MSLVGNLIQCCDIEGDVINNHETDKKKYHQRQNSSDWGQDNNSEEKIKILECSQENKCGSSNIFPSYTKYSTDKAVERNHKP